MPIPDNETKLLIELVKKQSITPADAGCQAMLAQRLTAAGFSCESMDNAGVSNLWARHGDQSPVLCFAGHTDVVPPGDPSHWDSDPFTPEIRGKYLYGRGAADMKSGIAAMTLAAERFVRQHPDHSGSVALLITSDEEGDAVHGTRRVIEKLVERRESIDWCVVGEPSSREQLGDVIRVGRRGSLSGHIRVVGREGHVAYPEQIDNPITRFAPALAALCNRYWDDGDEHFPPSTLQFVELSGGTGTLNVSPPDLVVRLNIRYSPAWTADALIDEIERVFRHLGVAVDCEWQRQGDPFLTAGGRLIDTVVSVIREETGVEPERSTGGGTSDGRFIAPTGAEVVELGPVNATIHKVNECVRLADVATLARLYETLARRLLG